MDIDICGVISGLKLLIIVWKKQQQNKTLAELVWWVLRAAKQLHDHHLVFQSDCFSSVCEISPWCQSILKNACLGGSDPQGICVVFYFFPSVKKLLESAPICSDYMLKRP